MDIYLEHEHANIPIVHKPTFIQALESRFDRYSEMFRAFLLLLAAHVVTQVPQVSSLLQIEPSSFARLGPLCRTISQAIQDRHSTHTSCTKVRIYILDYYHFKTVGNDESKTMALNQAILLAYSLGFNQCDAAFTGKVKGHIDLQLRRRMFYHLYTMDKMEASAGAEIIMDDSKGLPPYPAPVDDEYITTEGCAPQPHDQPSIMTAFTPHIELMILLSQCIIECRRYRTFQPPNAQQILSFADRAHDDMERIMQLLPSHLGPRPAYLKLPPASQPRIFAMQRANLMIAGMIVEFALLELESLVRTAIEIQADREDVGHAGCNLLTHLPVIHVAANGAYMFEALLRIVVLSTNLCNMSPNNGNMARIVESTFAWWSLYCDTDASKMGKARMEQRAVRTTLDYKTRIIGDYILEHLLNHKASENGAAPLMVAMQGPQGCDLYHTHESLLALRQRHPYNDLLAGRGLPGTHDLQLTRTTLDAVLNCNRATNYHQRIQLPVFDKSLFGGQGDRSTLSISVETPVDVFILEGWSMGFQPLGRDELCRQYEQARSDTTSAPPAFLAHSLDSLMEVNDYLGATSAVLYPPFSLLIQIRPESYSYVHAWRLQQEHQLIAARGTGMTDAQVEEFVTRYMPGYELWASGAGADVAEEGEACKGMWSGKSLVMWFGKERQVVLVDRV